MDKIAVLIPCYNESKTVGKVVTDFRRVLGDDAVIYVYDNNSTDGTAEIAENAGAVVRHEYQQGKGNVLRRMFGEIDAQCYLIVDGDDTYPAENAPEMVDRVLNHNADMVVGDRLSSTYFEENKRPFHNFGNTIVRASINLLFLEEKMASMEDAAKKKMCRRIYAQHMDVFDAIKNRQPEEARNAMAIHIRGFRQDLNPDTEFV